MTDIHPSMLRSDRDSNTVTSAGDRTRLNMGLCWVIIALLAVTPIPLGSTPPVTWTIWGTIIGLTGIVYFTLLARTGRKLSFRLSSMRLGVILHLVLCLYLVVQILPLSALAERFPIIASDGTTISVGQLSIAPGDTVLALVRMLSYGMLFFLTMQVAIDDRRRHYLLRAIVVVITLHALYALLALFQLDDTVLGAPKWKYFGDATGTFLNRNTFATYLAFGLACAAIQLASVMLKAREGRFKVNVDSTAVLYLLSVIILVVALAYTNSRMGFFLTWFVLIAAIVLTVARNVAIARSLIFVLPLLLVAAGAVILVFGEVLWGRLERSNTDFEFRLELYRQVMNLIARRPLLGFGGGTFQLAFPIVHEPSLAADLTWDKAHNTYLELWSELGVIFGSIPIVTIGWFGLNQLLGLARGKGSWTAQASCFVVLMVGALHSLVDFSLEIEAVTFVFIVLCAVGFAGSRVKAASL